jgi:hypothetical protein
MEKFGRIAYITEAPLKRGDTINGANAAWVDFEDRGASLPRGVATRLGMSKKFKSSSLKWPSPFTLPNESMNAW